MPLSLAASASTLLLSVILIILLSCPSGTSGDVYNIKSNNNTDNNSTFWEQLYLTLPDAAKTREYLQYYTSIPHLAGTPGDYETAVYTKGKFEEFGFTNVAIEEMQVLLTYPIKRLVEIVYPEEQRFVAALKEPIVPLDPTSNNTEAVDTFNGYAPGGNVTAELVFANYGRLQDFQQLASIGVNVTGKIVIVKYGQVFRGVKAMIAQHAGAVGVLIYSDPADDGYVQGSVYPDGPWRPEQGVQRGSVQYLQVCAGNPYFNLDCVPEGQNMSGVLYPNIPVQPLSWGDALPLLKGITNGAIPAEWGWAGGLNITYAAGPGPVQVHLETEISFNMTTIWNVIATMEGQDPSKSVLIGNHRDAWIFGATDPNSGSAAMLEIGRVFGVLASQGWKPRRNITFCSWDAEEYALVGSSGYAHQNKDSLTANAIAYLNIDTAVGGTQFKASGTPSLRTVIEAAAAAVPYPGDTTISVLQHWGEDKLTVLGSGSDYTAFIDNLGIASMDCGFGGISAGVYHSLYDSFYWMDNFGDPQYAYHKAAAQFLGLLTMKIADSVVLPFNYTNYADKLTQYTQLVEGLLNATASTPDIKISEITSSIQHFSTASNTLTAQQSSQNLQDASGVNSLNDRIYMAERSFLSAAGLPGRPFYKHVVQAPGLYSGYGADVFPALQQAIKDQNWDLATQQAQIIAQRISATASFVEGKPNSGGGGSTDNTKKTIIVISIIAAIALLAAVGGGIYYHKNKKTKYMMV